MRHKLNNECLRVFTTKDPIMIGLASARYRQLFCLSVIHFKNVNNIAVTERYYGRKGFANKIILLMYLHVE